MGIPDSLDLKVMRVEEKWVLRDFREKLGLTQQQVADRAGINITQYQRFEDGVRQLSSSSFRIACAVLRALDLSADGFVKGDYVSVGGEGDAEWDRAHGVK